MTQLRGGLSDKHHLWQWFSPAPPERRTPMFRPNVQRLSFDQAAQWRRSMRDAREMAADVFESGDLLRSWGRCAWLSPAPRCVWKRRRERAAQRWSVVVAEMAAREENPL